MRKDRRRKMMIVAATIFTLIYIWLAWLILVPKPVLYHAPPLTKAEKAYFSYWHKYHGISGSVCENGECWFMRDGKRCSL
jgi:hypothetical protein